MSCFPRLRSPCFPGLLFSSASRRVTSGNSDRKAFTLRIGTALNTPVPSFREICLFTNRQQTTSQTNQSQTPFPQCQQPILLHRMNILDRIQKELTMSILKAAKAYCEAELAAKPLGKARKKRKRSKADKEKMESGKEGEDSTTKADGGNKDKGGGKSQDDGTTQDSDGSRRGSEDDVVDDDFLAVRGLLPSPFGLPAARLKLCIVVEMPPASCTHQPPKLNSGMQHDAE